MQTVSDYFSMALRQQADRYYGVLAALDLGGVLSMIAAYEN
jgi:hypothetical protein